MLWLHEEAHLHQIRELIKRHNSLNSIDEALKVTAHLRLAGGTSAGFILINARRQNAAFILCVENESGGRGGATSEELQNGAHHSWRPRCSPGETRKNDASESWAGAVAATNAQLTRVLMSQQRPRCMTHGWSLQLSKYEAQSQKYFLKIK